MNRRTHLIIGSAFFLGYWYMAGPFHHSSGELLACGIIATAAGSLLPDILEPPISAQHRGIFHSRRALKSVTVIFLIAAVPVFLTPGISHFPIVFSASCFFLGYAVHLVADSLTRAGLPW